MPTLSAKFLTPQPGLDQPPGETRFTSSFWTNAWGNYVTRLDAMFRLAQYGPLVNAANDGAAAAAGVPVNGLYRTGNAVQIRLV